jgi:hypothetical protein
MTANWTFSHRAARWDHARGRPTTFLEVDGWRLLTDPTFDPPGRRSRSVGARRAAVLLTHDHGRGGDPAAPDDVRDHLRWLESGVAAHVS